MKLTWHILNNLIQNATSKDISLAIHLAQFADDDGLVCGVQYEKVCRAVGFSVSSFYKSLNHLESIGVIKVDWLGENYGGWGYWSMRFVDNDFTVVDSVDNNLESKNKDILTNNDRKIPSSKDKNISAKISAPYLNCNLKILHTKKFHKASKSEKVILLNLIRRLGYFFGKGSDYKGKKTIPLRLETLMQWTGKTRRSVMRILERLQDNFNDFVNFALDGNNVFVMRQMTVNVGENSNSSISNRNIGINHNINHSNNVNNNIGNTHDTINNTFNLHERRPIKEQDVKIFHAIGFVLDKLKVTTELDGDHQQETLTNICNTIKLYKVKGFNAIVNYIATTLKDSGYLSVKYFHSLLRHKEASNKIIFV
ncbi:MAG: hypothetical protein FWE33_00610 [Defluviitaleaceae bacterium]|nr:hypothetical protein [Defluviitaleaceae bacterium]